MKRPYTIALAELCPGCGTELTECGACLRSRGCTRVDWCPRCGCFTDRTTSGDFRPAKKRSSLPPFDPQACATDVVICSSRRRCFESRPRSYVALALCALFFWRVVAALWSWPFEILLGWNQDAADRAGATIATACTFCTLTLRLWIGHVRSL